MKSLWRFWTSTELTVVLAVLICLDAAWGSIITVKYRPLFQTLDHSILFQWLAVSGRAGLDKTLWIYLLIFLITCFALNTSLCTGERLWNIIRYRRPWRSFYPQIVHIGFLVALLGHLVGSMYGFRSQENIVYRGEAVAVPHQEALSLRLDSVETEVSPRGNLDRLATTVTLLRNKQPLFTDTIELNAPLRYRGIAFYHVDHGTAPTGIVLRVGSERFSLSFGESFTTGGGDRYTLGRIYPDFAITPSGTPYSRSNDYRNPYQEIITARGERGWLPLRQQGSRVEIGGVTVILDEFILNQYAVLNINKDPGIGLIVAGSTLLVIGMLLLLFLRGDRVELMRRSEGEA